MEASSVDLLILWDPANIRYFTGFDSLHWQCMSFQPAVCLLPLDQDVILTVPDFFAGVVEGCTYVKDIRLVVDPHITGNIRRLPGDIAQLVNGLGYGAARIGLESGWLGGMAVPRPINDIDALRKALDSVTLVDACEIIWRCRLIKSAMEVDAIRHATEAVVSAYNEVGTTFELGMSERDLSGAIRNAVLRHTEDCPMLYVESSSRQLPMPDTAARYSQIPLLSGNRIIVEAMPISKGYHGSCGRVFQVGPLSDTVLRKAEAVDRVQEATIGAVKPGARVSDLVDLISQALGEEGIDFPGDGQAGHCVGLTPHEPPMIARREDGVIEEGMVVAIEVWAVDAWSESARSQADSDIFGGEDLVVVTRDGCDPLPYLPRELRSLPF